MLKHWLLLRTTLVATPVVLAGALLPSAASAAAAPAASAASWHISRTFSMGSTIFSVTAVSSRDAWLAGATPASGLLVRRWTGSRWATEPVPASVTNVSSTVISANSATAVWAFANTEGSKNGDTALQWTGSGWKPFRFANNTNINAAAVLGPADAWAFGEFFEGKSGPYVRHFNGTSWHTVHTPIQPDSASATAPGNVWIVGPTAKTLLTAHPLYEAAVWSRGAWHLRKFPKLKLPSGTAAFTSQVLALGPRNVWVDFGLSKGEGVAPGAVLLHYNGSTWARVSVPFKSTFLMSSMTSDGRGGIWIATTADDGLLQYMYHLNAGRWTRMLMPSHPGDGTEVQAVAHQPGTSSVWAVGDMVPNEGGTTQGVVLDYRR